MAKETTKEAFLIQSLKSLVDGIAETFGSGCEVVLHDLRNLKKLNQSIVKIANGHVTGRGEGGPITDQGLRYLKGGSTEDLLINYPSVTKTGRHLKSSTIVFRDEMGNPIAAVCINFDITDILNFTSFLQDIFAVKDKDQTKDAVETFQGDIGSTLDALIDEQIRKVGKAVPSMEKADKIKIVKELESQGFFLIKGAIKLIAGKLSVSKYTIYNYLEEVRSAPTV
jgi:predicted transcriptional regulator YheO